MKILKSAVLYTALALFANTAMAADVAKLEALREGSLQKLNFLAAPQALPEMELPDMQGAPQRLADYRGKLLLVNFWATWCAPCREEMPALEALQRDLGGEAFQVLTIATGPNPIPAITRFFDEVGVESLPVLLDPRQKAARAMGVLGLPVTLVVDAQGQEVARLIGDAEWDSPSARAILAEMMPPPTD